MSSAVAADDAGGPTLKQRQDCEVTVTKGLVAFNADQIGQARDLFNEALAKWPACYFALEGLGAVAEREGKLKDAIEHYLRAKHTAPDSRWGFLNYHVGRIYLDLRAEDRAETYLKVAVEQGAFPAQANYLLGYLFYRRQEFHKAEKYFHRALLAARADEAFEQDKTLLQSTHFYLGEIYTRTGLHQNALRELWSAEVGASPEVRRAAWKLHSVHNRMLKNYGFGVFHRYDSNPALLSRGQPLPTELSGNASHGALVIWEGSIQSSPAKRFSLGADGALSWIYNLTSDVARFDELRILPSVWARYWNYGSWQVTARYDFSRTGYERFSYRPYEYVHGPALQGDLTPDHRWTFSGRYQLLLKSYPRETEIGIPAENSRDATAHVLTARAGLDNALHPGVRPAFQYQLTLNNATGENFKYVGHGFDALAYIFVVRKTEAHFGGNFEYRDYSRASAAYSDRNDKLVRLRAGVRTALYEAFTFSLDLNYTRNLSTDSVYAYDRFEANTGVIFRFQ